MIAGRLWTYNSADTRPLRWQFADAVSFETPIDPPDEDAPDLSELPDDVPEQEIIEPEE